MRVTVRLFARFKDIVRSGELQRAVAPGATARTVWDGLVAEFPELAPYTSNMSCAVNEEYARLSATVQDGDEVAFLPPVSGGQEWCGAVEARSWKLTFND
jgi:molybdopterin converting factor subunit 1